MIAEAEADFEMPTRSMVGQYRTFGETGPLYRILAEEGEDKVQIEVIHSGERLEYRKDRALRDPLAR